MCLDDSVNRHKPTRVLRPCGVHDSTISQAIRATPVVAALEPLAGSQRPPVEAGAVSAPSNAARSIPSRVPSSRSVATRAPSPASCHAPIA